MCLRLQEIWADNGDAISRQYAGTDALKGDFTRTGERKFKGLMKDGVNSASRYYMNRFKDAYRQGAIDVAVGLPVSSDILSFIKSSGAKDENSANPDVVSDDFWSDGSSPHIRPLGRIDIMHVFVHADWQ